MKTNPILFCDIDEVLLRHTEIGIHAEAIESLKMFRDAGFTFVLHSTWRHGMVDEAHYLFQDAGFDFVDATPSEPFDKRGSILAWLTEQYGEPKDWPRCVVIDDAHIEPLDGVEIVEINFRTGLTPEVARSAIGEPWLTFGAILGPKAT